MKLITIFLFLSASLSINAQGRIEYEYDEVGNRICQSCSLPILSKAMSSRTLPMVSEENNEANISINNGIGIKVYPNPTSDIVYVDVMNCKEWDKCRITLYNSQGALFFSQDKINKGTVDINLREYPSGMYILTVFVDNTSTTYKVIKQ